uniref:Uncharacterized protein n=1 Tax=Romanomermis culicivorax TaxID=13658 RepID=A0A915KFR2_ROMCU
VEKEVEKIEKLLIAYWYTEPHTHQYPECSSIPNSVHNKKLICKPNENGTLNNIKAQAYLQLQA